MNTNSKIDLEQVDSKNEKATRRSKSRSWFSNAAMVLLLANLVGVVCIFASGRASNTTVENRRLVDGHGDTVQVALNDFKVGSGGHLVDRASGEPLHTAASLKTRHSLTSLIPDKYLVELEYFSYTDELNNEVYVKVHSFARHPEEDAHCGSVVRLITSNGNFTLDDTHLYTKDGKQVTVAGHFDAERRLGKQHGRKLYTKTLDGFFAFIEKSDFKCTHEWKGEKKQVVPVPPKVPYTLTEYKEYSCEGDKDQCFSMIGENVRELKAGVTEDGQSILTINHILVTETQKVTVSYMPNQPTLKRVTVHSSDRSETTFQLFKEDMSKLYCRTKDAASFSNRGALKKQHASDRTKLKNSLRKFWLEKTHKTPVVKDGVNQTIAQLTKKGAVKFPDTFEKYEQQVMDEFDEMMEKKWAEIEKRHADDEVSPVLTHDFEDQFVSYLGTSSETYRGKTTELRHFAMIQKGMINNDPIKGMSDSRNPMYLNYYDTVAEPHMPYRVDLHHDADVLAKAAGDNARDPKAITRMLNFQGGLSDDDVNKWVVGQFGGDITSTDALFTYAKTDCNDLAKSVGTIKNIPMMYKNPYFEKDKHVEFHAKHYEPDSKNMQNMPITEKLYWSAAQKRCEQKNQLSMEVDDFELILKGISDEERIEKYGEGQQRKLTVSAMITDTGNEAGWSNSFHPNKGLKGNGIESDGWCARSGARGWWSYYHWTTATQNDCKQACEDANEDGQPDKCAGYSWRSCCNRCGLYWADGLQSDPGMKLLGASPSHTLSSGSGAKNGGSLDSVFHPWSHCRVNYVYNTGGGSSCHWKCYAIPETPSTTGSNPACEGTEDDYFPCAYTEALAAPITDPTYNDAFRAAIAVINVACGSGLIECPDLSQLPVEVPSSAYETCTAMGGIIRTLYSPEDPLATPGLVKTVNMPAFLRNILSMKLDIGLEFYTDDRCIMSAYAKLYSEADGEEGDPNSAANKNKRKKRIFGTWLTPTISILLGRDFILNTDDSLSQATRFEATLTLEVSKDFCASAAGWLAITGSAAFTLELSFTRNADNDPPYCPEGSATLTIEASMALLYSTTAIGYQCECKHSTSYDLGLFRVSFESADIQNMAECPETLANVDVKIEGVVALTNLCEEEYIDASMEITAEASVGLGCSGQIPVMEEYESAPYRYCGASCAWDCCDGRCETMFVEHDCCVCTMNERPTTTDTLERQATNPDGSLKFEQDCTLGPYEFSMEEPIEIFNENNIAQGVL